MDNNKVSIQIASPLWVLNWVFAMITMIFWGWFAGIYTGSLELPVGLIQLACFPVYLTGAVLLLKGGDYMNGTIFFLFSALFGGIGGTTNIALFFSNLYGWGISTSVNGIPFLWAGIAMVFVMYVLRKAPAVPFITYSVATLFLIVYGLFLLGVLGPGWIPIFKWMCFFIGIGALYSAMDGFLRTAGAGGLPCGPSIFK